MLLTLDDYIHTLSNASNESTQTLVDRKNAILLIEHFPVSVLRVSTGVRFQLLSLLEGSYVRRSQSYSSLMFLANLPNNQIHPLYLPLS